MLKLIMSAIAALAVLSIPLVAEAAGTIPDGTEFQVNTYTTDDQQNPQVCKAADGSFTVVWSGGPGQDGELDGIFAQRYASNGAKAGTEFLVNTYTTGAEVSPHICCDATGNFVVVWSGLGDALGSFGIFGQRFASNGTFSGTEFQVNTYTVGEQQNPGICCDASGNFAVVWEGYGPEDGDAAGVFGQRFGSDGAFLGSEFQVNSYTTGAQHYPQVCCDAGGDFVVVWTSRLQDGDYSGVFGQRFASGGQPRGTEFQVNTYTTQDQAYAAICCDADGDFVVAWQSNKQDGAEQGIFGQRFASNGGATGSEFQINTYTSSFQQDPTICCDPNGDFVVAWESFGQDGDALSIVARRFANNGFASAEFQVNTYTANFQENPAIACGPPGNFVVVWQSFTQDGEERGVFGQRFTMLALVPTPTLSQASTGVAVLVLIGAGAAALRRRRS